jgi:hypothetical protein
VYVDCEMGSTDRRGGEVVSGSSDVLGGGGRGAGEWFSLEGSIGGEVDVEGDGRDWEDRGFILVYLIGL